MKFESKAAGTSGHQNEGHTTLEQSPLLDHGTRDAAVIVDGDEDMDGIVVVGTMYIPFPHRVTSVAPGLHENPCSSATSERAGHADQYRFLTRRLPYHEQFQ